MQESLKECKKCKKFYDIRNINFCLNIAISEKLAKERTQEEIKYLQELNLLMTETTGIKWCTCSNKEKYEYLEEAIQCLEGRINNETKLEDSQLGFDFKLNEDIFYVMNEHNFDSFLFLRFIKSLKSNLKHNQLLSFDFLNYDKMNTREFNSKFYYSSPNYLLIYDFENIQEDQIDIMIKLNNIIKQRKSNNKKTFIVSLNKIEKLEKFLITRFYTKDEHTVLEFFNIIKNTFLNKKITTVEVDNKVKLNTMQINKRGRKRKTTEKEEQQVIELEL
jgi:hypothetical protein